MPDLITTLEGIISKSTLSFDEYSYLINYTTNCLNTLVNWIWLLCCVCITSCFLSFLWLSISYYVWGSDEHPKPGYYLTHTYNKEDEEIKEVINEAIKEERKHLKELAEEEQTKRGINNEKQKNR